MKCINCGSEIQGSRFCPFCGVANDPGNENPQEPGAGNDMQDMTQQTPGYQQPDQYGQEMQYQYAPQQDMPQQDSGYQQPEQYGQEMQNQYTAQQDVPQGQMQDMASQMQPGAQEPGAQGMPPQGPGPQGMPPQGPGPQGMPPQGPGPQGMPPQGQPGPWGPQGPQAVKPPRPPRPPRKPLSKKAKMIIACSAVLVVVATALIIFLATRPKKINMSDYVTINFTGEYNGYGYATYSVDSQKIKADIDTVKYRGSNAAYSFMNEQQITEFFIRQLVTTVRYEFDKSSNLSNGETVKLTLSISDEALAELENDYNVKLTLGDPIEATVSDLKQVETFDPFSEDYVKVVFEGVSPYGRAYYTIQESSPFDIYYSLDRDSDLSDGETVTLSVREENSYYLDKYGKVPATRSKEYKVSVGKYATSLSEIPKEALDEIDKQAKDVYTAEYVASWSEKSKMLDFTPVGSYFLKSKNNDGNIVYRLYRVKVSDTRVLEDSFEYFFGIGFYNLIINSDGSYQLDLMDYHKACETFYVSDVYYYGFTKIADFKNSFITSRVNEYEASEDVKDSNEDHTLDKVHIIHDVITDGDGTFTFEGHRYIAKYEYFSNTQMEEIRKACADAGGYLLTVNSQAEQDYIVKLVKGSELDISSVPLNAVKGEDGNWTWQTGEKWEYDNWTNKDGFYAYMEKDSDYKWSSEGEDAGYFNFYVIEFDHE